MYSTVSVIQRCFIVIGAICCLSLDSSCVLAKVTNYNYHEHIIDGGFETGIIGLEISRSPRYPGRAIQPPSRDEENPISGNYSLKLAGGKDSKYRLAFAPTKLSPSKPYRLSFQTRSSSAGFFSVEMTTLSGHKFFKKVERLRKGVQNFTYQLNLEKIRKFGGNWIDCQLFFRNIKNHNGYIWLDNISLTGQLIANSKPVTLLGNIEADRPLSVYHVGEKGKFLFTPSSNTAARYAVTITDGINGEIVRRLSLSPKSISSDSILPIQLYTRRRGYFVCSIQKQQQDWSKNERPQLRPYVVIRPAPRTKVNDRFFGMCLENHGFNTFINAFISPAIIYKLMGDIGVGSVRFTDIAAPGFVSKDGITFDFQMLDRAINLAKQNNLSVFIPLGASRPNRLSPWMRSDTSVYDSIDLYTGLRTHKLKKLIRKQPGGRYFLLAEYKRYLESILRHLKDKVFYYELWNEPGHKFRVDDFLKIAKLTFEVRNKIAPNARLLGYCSTKGPGIGQGISPEAVPQFLNKIIKKGGDKYIDILSFHSGHAYSFMGKTFDYRNQETGYVARIKSIFSRQGKQIKEIWDTERGQPWFLDGYEYQPNSHNVTRFPSDIDIDRSMSVFDSARQIPAIYASLAAAGVKRSFWFNFKGAAETIGRRGYRWSLFFPQMKPTPHIPVYNAMTEMLAGASFSKKIETSDGTRGYLFSRKNNTIMLIYNWLEKTVFFEANNSKFGKAISYDVMGNKSAVQPTVTGDKIKFTVGKWPVYIVFNDTAPTDLSVMLGKK